jgi:phosphohistidine phosphatase SixA
VAAASPLVRARETADLLGHRWRPAAKAETWEELRPMIPAARLLERIADVASRRRSTLIVGHEPQLSRFIGLATTGEGLPIIDVSKGGAIALDFETAVVPGGARIDWALTRGQLGRLRGRRLRSGPERT